MAFILGKLLIICLSPLVWVFVLLLGAVLFRKHRWAGRLPVYAFLVLWIFGNHWLQDLALDWWEPEPLAFETIDQPYDVGILLGGFSNSFARAGDFEFNLNRAGNRFLNTLELYKRGHLKKIMITGGSGNPFDKTPIESQEAREILRTLGVPDSNIIMETRSKNTLENALFSKALLEAQYPGARCALLTSATHLPRAHGLFVKAGLDCDPIPVDFQTERRQRSPRYWLLPAADVLAQWDLLLKEWVGYQGYKLLGKI